MDLNNKGTLKIYFELTDRVLKLIDEQAEEKMTRSDLQGVVEAIVMDAMDFKEVPPMDPIEKDLRAKWTANGVPQAKQDAIIADLSAKAQPGAHIGPFIVGGKPPARPEIKMNYYVLFILSDVEPHLYGPFATDEDRDARAKQLRKEEGEDHGIFFIDTEADISQIEVGAYSGGFFE